MNCMSAINRCTTCHGTGEIATEHGPSTCPACFGQVDPASGAGGAAGIEWRLREIERAASASPADVAWLVGELRRGRAVLLMILARCQDAGSGDALATEIKFLANEALGLYAPRAVE
jgi:hypothetical protein